MLVMVEVVEVDYVRLLERMLQFMVGCRIDNHVGTENSALIPIAFGNVA